MTGDLASDLLGGWNQPTGGSHPLTTIASSPQVLVFEADGTGQIWWTYVGVTLFDGGSLDFEWTVEDGHLIVNDLPPAEVVSNGPGSVIVQEAEGKPVGPTAWHRCGDNLRIPDRS